MHASTVSLNSKLSCWDPFWVWAPLPPAPPPKPGPPVYTPSTHLHGQGIIEGHLEGARGSRRSRAIHWLLLLLLHAVGVSCCCCSRLVRFLVHGSKVRCQPGVELLCKQIHTEHTACTRRPTLTLSQATAHTWHACVDGQRCVTSLAQQQGGPVLHTCSTSHIASRQRACSL